MFDILRREIERDRRRPFSEAAMASRAIVATADGKVSSSEHVRMDGAMASTEQLHEFNIHTAMKLSHNHAEAADANRRDGIAAAPEAIRRGAGGDRTAAALPRTSAAVSPADSQHPAAEGYAVPAIRDMPPGPAPVAT